MSSSSSCFRRNFLLGSFVLFLSVSAGSIESDSQAHSRRSLRRTHAHELAVGKPGKRSQADSGAENERGRHASEAAGQQQQHQQAQGGAAAELDYAWDGQKWWEWDNPKTLYFEPVAGLGNRLRALASAVVLAREFGVGLKVVWREEPSCGGDSCGNPGFNSTWTDLFSEPKLRLAPNFPGSIYNAFDENIYLRDHDRDDSLPPIVWGKNATVHYARSYSQFKDLLTYNFTDVYGEQVLYVKSDLWLTKAGEKEGKFFFGLLKPSPVVEAMINKFKKSVQWGEQHWIGVHVRRGDLTIYGKNNLHKKVEGLIPMHQYVDAMRKQAELAEGVTHVRYFLATDDVESEKFLRTSFKADLVHTFPKTQLSRLSVEGIQQALVDVLLLADCPVLIGTYYSSYSETAKLIGWPFYIQIGHALKSLTIETKFEIPDPEDEEEDRRRRRRLLALL